MQQRIVKDRIRDIIRDLEENRLEKALQVVEWLKDPDLLSKLEVMHLTDQTEGMIYSLLNEECSEQSKQVDNLPSIFIRTYDALGIPITYRGNLEVFIQKNSNKDKVVYSIKAFPNIEIEANLNVFGDVRITKLDVPN